MRYDPVVMNFPAEISIADELGETWNERLRKPVWDSVTVPSSVQATALSSVENYLESCFKYVV